VRDQVNTSLVASELAKSCKLLLNGSNNVAGVHPFSEVLRQNPFAQIKDFLILGTTVLCRFPWHLAQHPGVASR